MDPEVVIQGIKGNYQVIISKTIKNVKKSLNPSGKKSNVSVQTEGNYIYPKNVEELNKIIEKAQTQYHSILGAIIGGLVILYAALWIFLMKFQVLLSINDIFSTKHVERPVDPDFERVEDQSKFSYIGGFFTGLALVFVSAVLTYYIYIASSQNIIETIELVPSNTLSEKSGFKDKKITVFLGFNSLRYNSENCSEIIPEVTSSEHIEYNVDKSYTSDNKDNSYCRFKFTLKKSKTFESGDYVLFSFDKNCKECYTSDITVALESKAAYHDEKSEYFDSLVFNDGSVFQGKIPSYFYFEVIPAFYQDYTGQNEKNKYGYRIMDIVSPDPGSTSRNIQLNSGLSIMVQISLSQVGVYTSSVLKYDILGLFGVAVGAMSGLIGLISLIMNLFETAYFRYKYKHVEKPSAFKIEYERKIRIIEKRKIQGLKNRLVK